jgi:endo-1,4-beta-mannosidase
MTFELGVNYWPRRSAMYKWREFEIAEIRDEMAQIADIGFDVVRLFALTEDFLPGPATVDPVMVSRFGRRVVGAAKDAGLKVVPTLIVINMSGRFWWPEWMLDSQAIPETCTPTPSSSHRSCSRRRARAHWPATLDSCIRSVERD